jgi:hypothetical protein
MKSVTGYQIALGDNDEGRVEIGGGPGQSDTAEDLKERKLK